MGIIFLYMKFPIVGVDKMYKVFITDSYQKIPDGLKLIDKECGHIVSVTDKSKFTIIYEVPDHGII
jgi:hypothetical protein